MWFGIFWQARIWVSKNIYHLYVTHNLWSYPFEWRFWEKPNMISWNNQLVRTIFHWNKLPSCLVNAFCFLVQFWDFLPCRHAKFVLFCFILESKKVAKMHFSEMLLVFAYKRIRTSRFHGYIWAATQKQQSDCAPGKHSDQLGHPPSLIRVFAVRMKKAWVLSYPWSAQRRLIRLGESSLGAQSLCWFCHVVAHIALISWKYW